MVLYYSFEFRNKKAFITRIAKKNFFCRKHVTSFWHIGNNVPLIYVVIQNLDSVNGAHCNKMHRNVISEKPANNYDDSFSMNKIKSESLLRALFSRNFIFLTR